MFLEMTLAMICAKVRNREPQGRLRHDDDDGVSANEGNKQSEAFFDRQDEQTTHHVENVRVAGSHRLLADVEEPRHESALGSLLQSLEPQRKQRQEGQ